MNKKKRGRSGNKAKVLAHYSVGHSDDDLEAAWLVEECLSLPLLVEAGTVIVFY